MRRSETQPDFGSATDGRDVSRARTGRSPCADTRAEDWLHCRQQLAHLPTFDLDVSLTFGLTFGQPATASRPPQQYSDDCVLCAARPSRARRPEQPPIEVARGSVPKSACRTAARRPALARRASRRVRGASEVQQRHEAPLRGAGPVPRGSPVPVCGVRGVSSHWRRRRAHPAGALLLPKPSRSHHYTSCLHSAPLPAPPSPPSALSFLSSPRPARPFRSPRPNPALDADSLPP